jgi:hypothetical protein
LIATCLARGGDWDWEIIKLEVVGVNLNTARKIKSKYGRDSQMNDANVDGRDEEGEEPVGGLLRRILSSFLCAICDV